MSLYNDIIKKQYDFERKILQQKLTLASLSISYFAYLMDEGLGFIAVKTGEIIYLIKCKKVNVEISKKMDVLMNYQFYITTKRFSWPPKRT